MTAVTICSDFRPPKNKVWHCFYCFPIYFPWSQDTIFQSEILAPFPAWYSYVIHLQYSLVHFLLFLIPLCSFDSYMFYLSFPGFVKQYYNVKNCGYIKMYTKRSVICSQSLVPNSNFTLLFSPFPSALLSNCFLIFCFVFPVLL